MINKSASHFFVVSTSSPRLCAAVMAWEMTGTVPLNIHTIEKHMAFIVYAELLQNEKHTSCPYQESAGVCCHDELSFPYEQMLSSRHSWVLDWRVLYQD